MVNVVFLARLPAWCMSTQLNTQNKSIEVDAKIYLPKVDKRVGEA